MTDTADDTVTPRETTRKLISEILKGNLGAITLGLLILVLFLLGAFNGFGFESPLIKASAAAKAADETLAAVMKGLPENKQDHQNILRAIQDQTEEITVTNYILAECLRGNRGDCPKLPRPPRLQSLIDEQVRRERGSQ